MRVLKEEKGLSFEFNSKDVKIMVREFLRSRGFAVDPMDRIELCFVDAGQPATAKPAKIEAFAVLVKRVSGGNRDVGC